MATTTGHAVQTGALKRAVTVEGVGLFTGAPARVTLRPRDDGEPSGIVFRRLDLIRAGGSAADEGAAWIPALAPRVVAESRRTVLAADPDRVRASVAAAGPRAAAGMATVQTVEHLLSALAGLGVWEAVIDVEGPELPIGDGSSNLWVEAIDRAGIAEAAASIPAIVIREHVRIAGPQTGGACAGAVIEAWPLDDQAGPADAALFEYRLDFTDFPIAALAAEACRRVPAQSSAAEIGPGPARRAHYTAQVAPARTFCLAEEAQAMRAAGMFTHVSPRDLLVIGPEGPIDNTLRFPDEPARHKLLDLIGDLALCGGPLIGRIVATRTGHAQNQAMAAALAGAADHLQAPGL